MVEAVQGDGTLPGEERTPALVTPPWIGETLDARTSRQHVHERSLT
jgi:hypothetical protein